MCASGFIHGGEETGSSKRVDFDRIRESGDEIPPDLFLDSVRLIGDDFKRGEIVSNETERVSKRSPWSSNKINWGLDSFEPIQELSAIELHLLLRTRVNFYLSAINRTAFGVLSSRCSLDHKR